MPLENAPTMRMYGMNLEVEQWIRSETHRHYLMQDLELTGSMSAVSWFRDKTPEILDLSEREEDIAVGIFSINAVTAATLGRKDIEIYVDKPEDWEEVEPAILSLLGRLAGADEVHLFPSPQNPDQY